MLRFMLLRAQCNLLFSNFMWGFRSKLFAFICFSNFIDLIKTMKSDRPDWTSKIECTITLPVKCDLMYTGIWVPKHRSASNGHNSRSWQWNQGSKTAVTRSMPGIIGRKVTLTADWETNYDINHVNVPISDSRVKLICP